MFRRRRRGPRFGFLMMLLLVGGGYLWARGDGGHVTLFGGNTRVISGEFTGDEAGTLFGGQKYDLRQAEIPGRQAVLTLRTAFGGTEILVPRDWNVVVENTAIFGGVSNRTRPRAETGADPELIVEGLTLFGGLQIRN